MGQVGGPLRRNLLSTPGSSGQAEMKTKQKCWIRSVALCRINHNALIIAIQDRKKEGGVNRNHSGVKGMEERLH